MRVLKILNVFDDGPPENLTYAEMLLMSAVYLAVATVFVHAVWWLYAIFSAVTGG